MSPNAEDTYLFQWRIDVGAPGLTFEVVTEGLLGRPIPKDDELIAKRAEILVYLLEHKGAFNDMHLADVAMAVADKFKLHYVKAKSKGLAVEVYC